jgi:hypothetical protein
VASGCTAMQKLRIVTSQVWHGATENGRESAPCRIDLPPETPHVTIHNSFPSLYRCKGEHAQVEALLVGHAAERVVGVSALAEVRHQLGEVVLRPRCQILPLPISRYRFKFQSNLVWDSIKSISNFCFQF